MDQKLPQPSLFTQLPGNINEGQKSLLRLICAKHNKQETIGKDEIIFIYQSKVQRRKRAWDNCLYYDQDKKMCVGGFRDYTEWQIEDLAVSWVLRALGALVKKGYLTVIPRIDFSKFCLTEGST